MVVAELLTFATAFTGTLLLEFLILKLAQPLRLVALPNERSSHSQPTPTGGGLAIAIVVIAALLLRSSGPPAIQLGAAAAALAALGLLDDIQDLGRMLRFGVQVATVVGVLVFGFGITSPLWLPALCVAFLWFINLYNFMDGIDGIAGVQALSFAVGSLLLADSPPAWLVSVQLALAGGTLGFLAFNWPPARIFMGDVGSLSVGLVIAGVALTLVSTGSMGIVPAVILVSAFITDATWTIAARTFSGQNPFQSHRQHLYQILARRYGHFRTTLGFTLFSVLWIIPLAAVAAYHPQTQWLSLAIAVVPVLVLAFRIGAGRAA